MKRDLFLYNIDYYHGVNLDITPGIPALTNRRQRDKLYVLMFFVEIFVRSDRAC